MKAIWTLLVKAVRSVSLLGQSIRKRAQTDGQSIQSLCCLFLQDSWRAVLNVVGGLVGVSVLCLKKNFSDICTVGSHERVGTVFLTLHAKPFITSLKLFVYTYTLWQQMRISCGCFEAVSCVISELGMIHLFPVYGFSEISRPLY